MDYQMSDSQREEAKTNVHGSPPFHEERTAPTFSIGAAVREVVETILFILLIFLILRGVIQTFRIDGQSMEPNLHSQQYILVNKIIYFHFDANAPLRLLDRKSTRLNFSHANISYAVFCLKKNTSRCFRVRNSS